MRQFDCKKMAYQRKVRDTHFVGLITLIAVSLSIASVIGLAVKNTALWPLFVIFIAAALLCVILLKKSRQDNENEVIF